MHIQAGKGDPGVTAALGWRDWCNFKTRKQNKRLSCAAKGDETAC
jgi:hypothetical protein